MRISKDPVTIPVNKLIDMKAVANTPVICPYITHCIALFDLAY